ncbi:DUF1871 family protein [Paenibacillus senegalimassiliensis]|uniref:DUF1871 family protein n=1 Tax=Paenibacillus senegalimassiliensis TaxID=1737426 RepID=UPI001652B3F9|nr:DUF1871 family protein [Paenibacillus senegalimassiliensis]
MEQIINEWDPMSLFPHFPENEYRTEIEKIYNSYNKSCDKESLGKLIYKVFVDEFGDDVFKFDEKKCTEIASLILFEEKNS